MGIKLRQLLKGKIDNSIIKKYLSPDAIEAINNMTAEINENGELIINYDSNKLNINYEIVDGNLIFTDNTGLINSVINKNDELEVMY